MRIIVYTLIALLTIFMCVVLGDYGPWYFAWIIGTVMLVLISAAGGAMLDTQIENERSR